MNAYLANAINAFTLIIMGAWGYFGSVNPSKTALIPVFIGVILLVMSNGVKYENKVVAHIAVILTLLILVALIRPLMGSFESGNTMASVRVGLMMLTSALAMVYFIKSFIDARKKRKESE